MCICLCVCKPQARNPKPETRNPIPQFLNPFYVCIYVYIFTNTCAYIYMKEDNEGEDMEEEGNVDVCTALLHQRPHCVCVATNGRHEDWSAPRLSRARRRRPIASITQTKSLLSPPPSGQKKLTATPSKPVRDDLRPINSITLSPSVASLRVDTRARAAAQTLSNPHSSPARARHLTRTG
jgi:hypothetical protein